MTALVTVVVAGVGCYLLRISLVVLLAGRQPSPATIRLAGHVMPAAFASLAAVAILDATAPADGGTDPAPLIAGLVTVVVARRASSATTALVAGLAAAALTTAIV